MAILENIIGQSFRFLLLFNSDPENCYSLWKCMMLFILKIRQSFLLIFQSFLRMDEYLKGKAVGLEL